MNETVTKIVNLLFAKTVDNEETRALHDEVMNNCQEHYADLVSRGVSEDDAIHEIVVSLKGMEEVIAEYPAAEPEQDIPADAFSKAEMPKMQEFTLDGVKRIRVETVKDSIIVRPSEDHRFNLLYEGENETVVAENVGSTLNISLKRLNADGEKQHTWRDVFQKHEDGSFSFSWLNLARMIEENTKDSHIINVKTASSLVVEIPVGAGYELELNSRGGDVNVSGCETGELKMSSTGGDLKAILPVGTRPAAITMNTASGDITVEGSTGKLIASTMSGDVNITGDYGTVVLKSVSGDVELNGTIASMTASSVSGDVSLHTENTDAQNLHLNSVSGDIELSLPEGSAVNANTNTVSGDVDNRHPAAADARITVNAKTTSGDISIL